MDVVDRVRLCRKDVATAEGREVSRSRGSNSEFVRPWPTSQYQESIYFRFWCIQGHLKHAEAGITIGARDYASAIAHSSLRDQPRRRRPRPNENCPFRMRWASSMPAIVIAAFANDLKPAIDAHRRLMARWSCSIRLLRYLLVLTFAFRQQGCSRRSSHNARRLGTCPSSVTLRGTRENSSRAPCGRTLAQPQFRGRVGAGNRRSCRACRQHDRDSATWL